MPTSKVLELTRDVTKAECSWLNHDFVEGDRVFKFVGPTFGCISYDGIACAADSNDEGPFFELPADAVQPVMG